MALWLSRASSSSYCGFHHPGLGHSRVFFQVTLFHTGSKGKVHPLPNILLPLAGQTPSHPSPAKNIIQWHHIVLVVPVWRCTRVFLQIQSMALFRTLNLTFLGCLRSAILQSVNEQKDNEINTLQTELTANSVHTFFFNCVQLLQGLQQTLCASFLIVLNLFKFSW